MDYEFLVDGRSCKFSLDRHEGKIVFARAGRSLDLDIRQVRSNTLSLLVDGKSYVARIASDREHIFISIGAFQFCLTEPDRVSSAAQFRESSSEKAEGTIKAPMPGMVIKVSVSEGSEVNSGDGLVVVEAMKMEHEMRAAFDAIVDKVYVRVGQQVDAFQPLMDLKAKGPAL